MGRKTMIVVWPAFLMACVLEVLVFAVVDPTTVHASAPAVYTAGFFVFWAAIAAAGAITQLLEREPPEVNRPHR
jgi:hypothetical protein